VGIRYPILTTDPGAAWNLTDVDAIPTTFIIDPQGQVVKKITGTTTENALLNTIEGLQSSSKGH
jgi:hypothetical protein